jgi:hypothetical protein
VAELPHDVVNKLGGGNPRAAGTVMRKLFAVNPESPTTIPAATVRALGHGDPSAGYRVLQKFAQLIRQAGGFSYEKIPLRRYASGGGVDDDEIEEAGPRPKAGQTVPPVDARPMTGQAAMTALGIPDISSMTPDEQQMFALGAVPMLAAGPEARVAEEAAPAVARGIRAFHGSPFDFDRFALSKIGSGEGAQAYGHGLYFAENPSVANEYKQSLSKSNPWEWEGKPVSPGLYTDSDVPYEVKHALSWLEGNQKLGETTPDLIQRRIKDLTDHAAFLRGTNDPGNVNAARMYDSGVRSLSSIDPNKLKMPTGKMYEVIINADPEHFLDWDAPLSEQHPKVQEAFGESVKKEAYGRALASTDKVRADELWGMVKDPIKAPVSFAKDLLQKPEVVDQLRQAGIPGIKYLDQGSRGTSGGTRNFVVFDDKLIDIIKKYGLAGLIAAGAAHFKLPAESGQYARGGKVGYRRIPLRRGGKMSKAAANYRDSAEDNAFCARCSMHLPRNNSCTLVAGPVHRVGLCDYFEKAK